jgi:hypothetical protein
LSEVSLLYGWGFDYILNKFSFAQIQRLHEYGWKYDFMRRGIKCDYYDAEKVPFEKLRDELYTPEERKAQEEAIAKNNESVPR